MTGILEGIVAAPVFHILEQRSIFRDAVIVSCPCRCDDHVSGQSSRIDLLEGHCGFDLDRDAFRFQTLDEALTWAEATKEMWTVAGWTELAC